MNSTADETVYDLSTQAKSVSNQTPFLKKDVVYIPDENGSTSYDRNEIVFNTINLSNNGRWCDYANDAYISIPVVVKVSRNAEHEAGVQYNAIRMKSGCSMVDSIAIEYMNSTVVQQRRNIHAYSAFKQHTTLSKNDVDVFGECFSYYKPSSDWTFNSASKKGLISGDTVESNVNFYAVPSLDEHKEIISADSLATSGADFYEKVGNDHYYYFDQRIRLKDLLFFADMPLVRGTNIKLTLTLNQGTFVHDYVASALDKVTNSLQGSSCPVLRCNASDYKTSIETIDVKVVKNGVKTHKKTQCRMYVPTYVLESKHELELLNLGVRKVKYSDIYVSKISNVQKGTFQHLLTNSIARLSRLIIVPILNKASNSSLSMGPMESCYTSEPSVCSPHVISDFNVLLSGSTVYNQPMKWKYDFFINELMGKFGNDNGLLNGTSSSLISMRDYENRFGYLVVDLRRRLKSDNNTPISVEITGSLLSELAMDFYCYLEFDREIQINSEDGSLVE